MIPTKIRRQHVRVDALFLWCIDPHFRAALWDLEKEFNLRPDRVDIIKTPGGAKALTEEGHEQYELLRQIGTSIGLHRPKLLIPMFHVDCGAYKHLQASKQKERKFFTREVQRAKEALRPFRVPVRPVIVDFDKILVF